MTVIVTKCSFIEWTLDTIRLEEEERMMVMIMIVTMMMMIAAITKSNVTKQRWT